MICAGVEVSVGSEVVCCVLCVEGEVVRVSLNPALVEGREREGERRKKKRKSGQQNMVSRPATPLSLSPSLSHYISLFHHSCWLPMTLSWEQLKPSPLTTSW